MSGEDTLKRSRISHEQYETLKAKFREGETIRGAAKAAGVHWLTAQRHLEEDHFQRPSIKSVLRGEKISARAMVYEAEQKAKELEEREQALRAEEVRRDKAKAEMDAVLERARVGQLLKSAINSVVGSFAIQAKWSKLEQQLGDRFLHEVQRELNEGTLTRREMFAILKQIMSLKSEAILEAGNVLDQLRKYMGDLDEIESHTGDVAPHYDLEEVAAALGPNGVKHSLQKVIEGDLDDPGVEALFNAANGMPRDAVH